MARPVKKRAKPASPPLPEEIALRRKRAEIALATLTRYYDAASTGRRTEGWRRVSGDGNAAAQKGLNTRDTARDLVRNNAIARAAVSTIVDRVIGWGITPTLPPGDFAKAWTAWAETTACDADHRRTLHGLARQATDVIVTAGEVLIRRRLRRPEDGLTIPMQLQVLEPDFLDDTLDRNIPENGGEIIQGIEYSPIGAPVAYWCFPEHPGSNRIGRAKLTGASQRIRAEEMLHVALPDRPGQARGVSWFAPTMLRLKDLDDYQDAALIKQKVAACLAVILTDSSGAGTPMGMADDTVTPGIDALQPGLIARFAAGDSVEVVQPPSVNEHGPYTKTVLQEIATGMGISYEDLTGDYGSLPYSAARMSRIRSQARIEAWRWDMMIPQFYARIWDWAVQLAPLGPYAQRAVIPAGYLPTWTPPPLPMLDPNQEGLAYIRNIRGGLQTWSDVHRELGNDPKQALKEMREDWAAIDAAGLILDSDARKMTQAGQLQGEGLPTPEPPAPAAPAPEPDQDEERERREMRADLVRLWDRMERNDLIRESAHVGRNGHEPQPITVNSPVTIEKGAFHLEAPPAQLAPALNIDARTTVEPAAVHVTTPDVNVDARHTWEKDSIRFTLDPPDPAPVTVNAPITVQPAAVHVAAPVIHVEPAPVPEPRPMRYVVEERDEHGDIKSSRSEPIDGEPTPTE